MQKTKYTFFALMLVIIVIGIAGYLYMPYSASQPASNNQTQNNVFCTMEAKLCPDGSYVGRTGPNCEFAPCPSGELVPNHWKKTTDVSTQISFRYPEQFATTYIRVLDWPPKIQLLSESFKCVSGGSPTSRAGKTEQKIIDGDAYCVTEITEGAAGNIYTQYAYAAPYQDKTIIFTFSTRAPQCGNYDDPQKTECEQERADFDTDEIIPVIIRNIQNIQ